MKKILTKYWAYIATAFVILCLSIMLWVLATTPMNHTQRNDSCPSCNNNEYISKKTNKRINGL